MMTQERSMQSPPAVSATVKPRHLAKRYGIAGRLVLWAALVVVTFIALFPLLYALTTSFKTPLASFDGTMIPWLQYQPTLANWQAEFGSGGPETFKALGNSILIAISATLFATTL